MTGSEPPSTPRPPSDAPASDGGRFPPGTVLAERYRVIGLIGAGGMGEVYFVDDLVLGQPVALKLLSDAGAKRAGGIERLMAEVRLARKVTHPNVARVHDVGRLETGHFLTMEYVDGEDLAHLLVRIGRLPGEKANQLAQEICAGVAAAHEHGVLHRDLKPANVLVDGRGHARITDFGLAVSKADTAGEGITGTPAFMAPEQIAGGEVNERSELYSLGLVLYELYTGRPAFEGKTFEEWTRLHKDANPRRPSSVVPDIDPAVERVIEQCLEKDPARRPASARSVAAALPGGDPIAAALAAGETPSPELIAASGGTGALTVRAGLCLLGALALLLALLVTSRARTGMAGKVPLELEPAVLRHRAREVLANLGYDSKGLDSAAGMYTHGSYLEYLRRSGDDPARWERLREPWPPAYFFWYREAPGSLVPLRPARPVTFDDPPPHRAGSVGLQLTPDGRLDHLMAYSGGTGYRPRADAPGPLVGGDPDSDERNDWRALFDAAGLDPARYRSAAPLITPHCPADAWYAWTSSEAPEDGGAVRVEAAFLAGRPVWFVVIDEWNIQGPGPEVRDERERLATIFSDVGDTLRKWIVVLAMLLGALAAHHNLKLGRGNRQGALRLAVVVVALRMAQWAFEADHVAAFMTEFQLASSALAQALYFGLVAWVLYLGLEPYCRRAWPDLMVSWNRLLAGRSRDPLVGRELLLGLLGGVVATLLETANQRAGLWFGTYASEPTQFTWDLLGGWSASVARSFRLAQEAVQLSFSFLVLLVLLRVVLRAPALAVLGVLVVGALADPSWASSGMIVVDKVFDAAVVAVLLALLLRSGMVAVITGVFTLMLLDHLPYTVHVSAWYAKALVFALLLLAVLAVAGFRTACPPGGVPRHSKA